MSEGRDLSLTREQIIGLLAELGRELDDRGVRARVVLDLPGITVTVPSPHYLLALKVQAARIDRDQDDIRFLAREAGAKTADDVLKIAEQVIGPSRLLPKAQFIVQEMFPTGPPESPPP